MGGVGLGCSCSSVALALLHRGFPIIFPCQENMPLEETAWNLLIIAAIGQRQGGDFTWLEPYWPAISTWCEVHPARAYMREHARTHVPACVPVHVPGAGAGHWGCKHPCGPHLPWALCACAPCRVYPPPATRYEFLVTLLPFPGTQLSTDDFDGVLYVPFPPHPRVGARS